MKRNLCLLTLITLIALITVSAGCHPPVYKKNAGPVTTMYYHLTGFTAIETGSAFKIDISKAATYGISITTNERAFDYLNVHLSGETLKIETTGLYWQFQNIPHTATITMPDLYALNLSGAALGTAVGFESEHDFHLSLSGASELDMDMQTGDFDASLSGASRLKGILTATSTEIHLSGDSHSTLAGTGGDLTLIASGASIAKLKEFTINDAAIGLSGASNASLYVNGNLDADLSGASYLEYQGNPSLGAINLSGGSSYEYKEG